MTKSLFGRIILYQVFASGILHASRESRCNPSYRLLLASSKGLDASVFSLSLADRVADGKLINTNNNGLTLTGVHPFFYLFKLIADESFNFKFNLGKNIRFQFFYFFVCKI